MMRANTQYFQLCLVQAPTCRSNSAPCWLVLNHQPQFCHIKIRKEGSGEVPNSNYTICSNDSFLECSPPTTTEAWVQFPARTCQSRGLYSLGWSDLGEVSP